MCQVLNDSAIHIEDYSADAKGRRREIEKRGHMIFTIEWKIKIAR